MDRLFLRPNMNMSSMNPNVLDASNKRKVVRGGWKDVAYFLQVSTRFRILILQEFYRI
jgi:hypothetical protein